MCCLPAAHPSLGGNEQQPAHLNSINPLPSPSQHPGEESPSAQIHQPPSATYVQYTYPHTANPSLRTYCMKRPQ